MSDDEKQEETGMAPGMTEAQIRMEEEKKKRMAKMEEEMREYEEMRKEEREKLQAEIADLRVRREKRRQERAEEEQRMAEMRAIEEQKRRAEEEERQRRKREEEAKRQEEREKKRREAEERNRSQRNFTISKKSTGEAGQTEEGAAAADDAQQGKSREQIEAERKAALEQRIKPLNIDGLGEQELQEKAKQLFNAIYSLEGDKYDLEQRFKAQSVEVVELKERARQMQKGGQKGGSNKVQTAPDPLAEKIGGIPPKIVMYSQYERVKDHRNFNERQDLFKGPIYGVEYERIKPTSRVVLTEQGPRVIGEFEENGEEPPKEEQPQEQPQAEEAAAE